MVAARSASVMAFSERLTVGEGTRNMIDPARKCQPTPLRRLFQPLEPNSRLVPSRPGIFSSVNGEVAPSSRG